MQLSQLAGARGRSLRDSQHADYTPERRPGWERICASITHATAIAAARLISRGAAIAASEAAVAAICPISRQAPHGTLRY